MPETFRIVSQRPMNPLKAWKYKRRHDRWARNKIIDEKISDVAADINYRKSAWMREATMLSLHIAKKLPLFLYPYRP